MKIDTIKLDLQLARQLKSMSDLRKVASPGTLTGIRRGNNIKPSTLGRIAKELNVDPSELISEGGGNRV